MSLTVPMKVLWMESLTGYSSAGLMVPKKGSLPAPMKVYTKTRYTDYSMES